MSDNINKDWVLSITLPWSKSITNRALVIAALTDWKTTLKSILFSDDTNHMIESLKQIWINIEKHDSYIIVNGWIEKIVWNNKELYVWQSWLCMRFLTALIIFNQEWTITLTWEEKLLTRPMWDLFDSLKQMWIKFEANWNFPPVKIFPSEITNNIIQMNWNVTSQFFTALLQIAPLLKNWLKIEVVWDLVSKPYIDLSINEINKFWVKIINNNYKSFSIDNQKYSPVNLIVEWDASALSYIANYIVLHWWKIRINNLWNNSKQWDYKYLEKLKHFWLKFSSDKDTTILEANWIQNTNIHNLNIIDFEDMPDVSMSFMSLAIFIPWKTIITWLQTLNLKECKRLDVMKSELEKIWIEIKTTKNSIIIWKIIDFPKKTINIETYNDHRIAMVFWILNTYIWNLNILNPNCVNKTYPNFWKDLEKLHQK